MPTYKDTKTGKWYCQFWLKDWTGKNRHITKRGFERKKDAEKYEADMKRNTLSDKVSMSKLISDFEEHLLMKAKVGAIKESTAFAHRNNIKYYIYDYFAEVKDASLLKPKDINKWLEHQSVYQSPSGDQEFFKNGKPVPKKRSSSTIRNARNTLNQIFEFAIDNYGFEKNPVEKSSTLKPFSNDTRADFWTIEQYNTFYFALKDIRYKILFNILYWSGLRIGEALALTPNDITPYKISVNKGISRISDTETKIDTPKTETSIRSVEIPRNLYFQIQEYIAKLYGITSNDHIFSVSDACVRRMLNSTAKRCGLPRISPHILRHSYASILYNQTKDAMVVAKQIGHKDASVTLQVYSHMLPEEDRKAIDDLETIAFARSEVINHSSKNER